MMLAAVLKSAPKRISRFFDRQRSQRRLSVFDRALRRFMNAPIDGDLPFPLLKDLVYGWDNTWSAQEEYIRAFLRAARQARGPILECGSGLSTVLLGAVAQRTGNRVWSLEHDPLWLEKVRKTLSRHAIDAVTLCLANIVSYGPYSWYAPTLHRLPRDFGLIVCDGPPGTTPGGRYGFLPVMRSHCRQGCEILLDDAARPSEHSVLEKWAIEMDTSFAIEGEMKPFGRLAMR